MTTTTMLVSGRWECGEGIGRKGVGRKGVGRGGCYMYTCNVSTQKHSLSLLLPPCFTGAVLFISTLSILISLFQTRRQLQQLHDLVALSCTVNILRDGKGEGGGVGREYEEEEDG